MKKVVIILVVLVGLASAAAYMVIGGGGDDEEAKAADDHAAEAHGSAHTYINLPAFSVSIFRDNRPAGRLVAVLTLDVNGASGEAAVRANTHQLRDAYFRTLHDIAEQMPPDAVNVDLDLVKNRIMGVTNQIVEGQPVREILVQNLFVQRRR